MADKHKNPTFALRLPDERREWVKHRAQENNRSISAEINFILESFKKQESLGYVPRTA